MHFRCGGADGVAPGACGGGAGAHPDVALGSRVRAAGTQAHQRIDDERQRARSRFDFLDRFRGGVVRRWRPPRESARPGRAARWSARVPLADWPGSRSPSSVMLSAGGGQIVRRENGLDAGHRQRRARIDAADARVRHRAEQQLAEEHAVGAIVLGVLRLAGDLRDQVGGRGNSCRSI